MNQNYNTKSEDKANDDDDDDSQKSCDLIGERKRSEIELVVPLVGHTTINIHVIKDAVGTLHCYKAALLLIALNLFVFHLGRVLYYLFLVACFVFSFLVYFVKNNENRANFNKYLHSRRKKNPSPNGFIKIDSYLESMIESNIDLTEIQPYRTPLTQRPFVSTQYGGITKPALTGSYLIDDQIHQLIELILRDYIDVWYKNEISSKEDFKQTIRLYIYNAVRYITFCLREIDWEQFIMNILVHNLVFQMRMLKKAKEKRSKLALDNTLLKNEIIKAIKELTEVKESSSPSMSEQTSASEKKKILINDLLNNGSFLQAAQNYANLKENNLIELFFDLEAEREKGVCRDDISLTPSERENDLLQELSEIFCFSLLPLNDFNCLPLRCLLREILSNHLLKTTVNNLTDPDYINQTILYLCQDQVVPKTENFLITFSNSDSLDELRELRNRIEDEILKTRSNDKGGQDDQEIKQRLSSLQYIKRKIESYILNLFKINNKISSPNSDNKNRSGIPRTESELFLFNQQLSCLDFKLVCTDETIQHCFIEFMGKQNVQNLISFYLNADMYRQFAVKEMERNGNKDEVKQVLKDFANGLINSYLLCANNFKTSIQDDDDQPVNICNRQFYKPELIKTVERLEMVEHLNETLLDDLQAKIFELMKQKYYPDFKSYPEFQKILHKNDLLFKLTANNVTGEWITNCQANSPKSQRDSDSPSFDLNVEDDDFTSSLQQTGLNDSLIDEDSLVMIDDGISDRISQASIESVAYSEASIKSNSSPQGSSTRQLVNQNFKLSAQITSSGVCNDLKSSYAIYIIDVTKIYPQSSELNDYWQTYRRFNDFYDLHLTIKKRFPHLSNFTLPGKSFRHSLSDEFLEKRKCELNRYLQTLSNPDIIANNPGLIDLLLQFLENKPYDSAQTNFKRRVNSIFTPMISSVQNIQTSINENVIGMVKGISDNLNPVVNTFSKMNNSQPSLSSPVSPETAQKNSQLALYNNSNSKAPTPKIQIDRRDLIAIDKNVLNTDDMQSNNFPVRVLLMLVDEIFDLKEKNQWIRQSLMLIVKTFMKNFKGDSMNKKIKEQIADLASEEYLAKYFKNFRKRLWPKGYLADVKPERSNSVKEITKILAKTKLLGIVSDDLRHVLGNDATRRGIFEVFDLFQHKALNNRLFYVLAENLLANFFETDNNLNFLAFTMKAQYSTNINSSSYQTSIQNSPLIQLIRCHLSRSHRVKPEWRILEGSGSTKSRRERDKKSASNSTSSNSLQIPAISKSSSNSQASLNEADKQVTLSRGRLNLTESLPPSGGDSSASSIQRSRSLYTDMTC